MSKFKIAAQWGLFGASIMLSGCASWFSGDRVNAPSPLPAFEAKATVLIASRFSVGGGEHFGFSPANANGNWFAVSEGGSIASQQGKVVETGQPLAAGIGANAQLLAVVTQRGEVLAYGLDGKKKWALAVDSEILAAPLVDNGMVVVKTTDSRIIGIDAETGKQKWLIKRTPTALTLRNFVGGMATEGVAYIGMPNGHLIAIDMRTGAEIWDAVVSQARGATELERVVDVTSLPVVGFGQVCSVAYQGKTTCLKQSDGTPLWSRNVGSSKGLAMNETQLVVTDTEGGIHAFSRTSGAELWTQNKLKYRGTTGPALTGNTVVVADDEGVVHVLAAENGSYIARLSLGGRVVAQPIGQNNQVVVQTVNGDVYALTVNR